MPQQLAPAVPANPPDARIQVDGVDFNYVALGDLISVTVQEDMGALSMFTIELANWDQHDQRHTWSDSDLFLPGADVTIALGYVNDVTPVMSGQVLALEPSFVDYGPSRLVVRGYDRGHLFHRGRKTRSFEKQKDSQIIQSVVREQGMKADVKDSKIVHDHVLQHNQTDWEFLSERARLNGWALRVDDRTVVVRHLTRTDGEPVRLRLSEHVIAFHPRLTAAFEGDSVRVQGWNPMEKKPIVSTAAVGQLTPVGQGTVGLRAAASRFGRASIPIVDTPVAGESAGVASARAELDRRALGYVTAELVCRGRPGIHQGDQVRVEEAGDRFSGVYLVTGVQHQVELATGFRTRLFLRRSAA